ncbi:hypothetical protein [Streptomyces sp. NBC_01257]|uniref:hypothetical protein n=1 Tax=Streptomyces sp. NBC_01257 TaxID=2903799 RepID=UPI002DD84B71|nr:hypothetical protein [Streptomyces sp. NBC_01257]WRZ66156.1 hypothetical protein OG408_20785 [Streptomyces sp. NBC_01257]
MSRSSWCCLLAALAVVLGLFCGPATATAAVPSPLPDASVAAVTATETVARDIGQRDGLAGCGRRSGHDGGEPGVPGRSRAAHDQAPGLAEWGLPEAVGPEPLRWSAPMNPRGPDAAAPTPVELSVLRV